MSTYHSLKNDRYRIYFLKNRKLTGLGYLAEDIVQLLACDLLLESTSNLISKAWSSHRKHTALNSRFFPEKKKHHSDNGWISTLCFELSTQYYYIPL